jgi:hypothetical protein
LAKKLRRSQTWHDQIEEEKGKDKGKSWIWSANTLEQDDFSLTMRRALPWPARSSGDW